jgi:NADH-quinone oxidoreductase subunit C
MSDSSSRVEAGLPAPTDPDSAAPLGPIVPLLRSHFGDAVLKAEIAAGDQVVVWVDPVRNVEVLDWLRTHPATSLDFLVDVTAVDFGGGRPLTVVYQLWSIALRHQLRVKCELPLDALSIRSIAPIWQSANWLEREVWDLFGITFEGHPDLRRILMPENYEEGHPLRKDFPLRGRFSRAEQTRRALSQDPHDYYIPAEIELGGTPQVVPARSSRASVPGGGSVDSAS